MTPPRLLLLVLALLASAVAAATVLGVVDARRPTARVTSATATATDRPAPRTAALEVLADWDGRRSAAWAAGDAAALADLYAPGSRAGRADVAMLRRWSARGLRVTGLRMQVLEVRAGAPRAGRWELRVTDRLAGGVAVGRRTTAALPRDNWSTRRIVLTRARDRWRVAEVSAVRP